MKILKGLWRDREVITQLTRREVHATYRESLLGTVWLLLQPLLSLAVYAFVFTVLFRPRASAEVDRFDFVLGMFAGMVVYWCFSEVIGKAPRMILSKPSYVKNIVFPLEVLPVCALGSALVGLGGGIAILLAVSTLVRHSISPTLWLFPVVLVPLICLTLGLAWLFASLGVFLRDLQHAVRSFLQLLFFATPIVWTVDILPESLQSWIHLNPLVPIVEGARRTLVEGRQPNWGSLGITMLVALAVMTFGYLWFNRTRRGFSDVL